MRSFAIALTYSALLLPLAALAQAPPDAASLLGLHRSYVGWEFGDGTFTSLRIHSQYVPNGASEPTQEASTLLRGAIFRTSQIDAKTGSTLDVGFTGRVFWASDENGFTRPIYGDYQQYLLSRSVLFGEGTALLTGTLEPSASIDGAVYPVVRVQPPHGDPIDVYIDPKSGAYVRAVIDPGGSYSKTFDILAYTDALPGRRMISTYRMAGDSGTYEFTKFEPNVE